MKILVIGGTNFFGKDVVEFALDARHKVTVFSRGNQRPKFWNRIDHIPGDRTDEIDFANKLSNKQFDIVIDNIAYNSKHVANALAVFRGNVGRYILTSSEAVYIGTGPFDHPVFESDANFTQAEIPMPVSLPDPTLQWMINYARGKIEAEKAVNEQLDVPYTIIRPPYISGPEDTNGICQFYFQRLLDGKPLILRNGGFHTLQPVFRCDLARSYLLALSSPKAVNQVYNIAQTKGFRLVDWVELIAKCLGVRPNIINIPANLLQQADFDYAESATSIGAPTLDTMKARTDLGFQPTPVETWTKMTAQWYLNTTHEIDSRGYIDRKREVEFAEKYIEKTAHLDF